MSNPLPPPPVPPIPAAPAPVAAPPPGSGRKWIFWGCGGCLTLVIIGAIAVGLFFSYAMKTIKGTEIYSKALDAAKSSPEVQEAMGTPIEADWMIQGSVNTQGGRSDASLLIPISGPKGKGSVDATASKTGEVWNYTRLQAQLPDGKTVDLLPSVAGPNGSDVPALENPAPEPESTPEPEPEPTPEPEPAPEPPVEN